MKSEGRRHRKDPGKTGQEDAGGEEIRPVTGADAPAIAGIFNHYVRRSFAAFPDRELGIHVVRDLLDQAGAFGCYAVEREGEVIGFGLIRPLSPHPNLIMAGEVSYFIRPGLTGKGLGTRLLGVLEGRAGELGMTSLVARVASRNRRSIRFHRRNGFSVCGRIRRVGIKFGRPFDAVILQKLL
ncbi:MAG TPA: GNAT family N-acetyltransferase [Methanomicrobiales archaeon]|nr:GNAT family N-acetyltransferase [Methanomicrobiales archaeon]